MKRPSTIAAWWNGGRGASRTAAPIDPPTVPHRGLIGSHRQPMVGPEPVKDPVLDQARAVESFGDFQVRHGTDLLKENKPIETAVDLQNVNAALELNPTLARPEPEVPQPMQRDLNQPVLGQPGPGPLDPEPMPEG